MHKIKCGEFLRATHSIKCEFDTSYKDMMKEHTENAGVGQDLTQF